MTTRMKVWRFQTFSCPFACLQSGTSLGFFAASFDRRNSKLFMFFVPLVTVFLQRVEKQNLGIHQQKELVKAPHHHTLTAVSECCSASLSLKVFAWVQMEKDPNLTGRWSLGPLVLQVDLSGNLKTSLWSCQSFLRWKHLRSVQRRLGWNLLL